LGNSAINNLNLIFIHCIEIFFVVVIVVVSRDVVVSVVVIVSDKLNFMFLLILINECG
jgi:hypothetical protein